MATDALLVHCTCPDPDTARSIAAELVDRRLAACCSVLPGVTSIYRWDGEIQTDNECLLIVKTRSGRYADLESHLKSRHPYELPEIVAVPVTEGLPPYLEWITDSTTE